MNIFDSYVRSMQEALCSLSAFKGPNKEKPLNIDEALTLVAGLCISCRTVNKKLLFIGNGGSAAIASHMALDFSNRGKIKSVPFVDSTLLTCLANDYGFPRVFEKYVEMNADPDDVLIAISSSGQSANVLNGVIAARRKGCKAVTLSGFSDDNPLLRLGDINMYVPIPGPLYRPVEDSHQIILHFILDLIEKNSP